MASITLYCGEIWHTPAEPRSGRDLETFREGALAVEATGRIVAVGPRADLVQRHRDSQVVDFGDDLILPGFVDGHVHFPQVDMIGAYGERLLGWLETYTFPMEAKYAEAAYAQAAAQRFVTELLANGTTLAAVYASSHRVSAEAMLAEADRRGIRAIVGKVSMDQGAPAPLLADAARDQADNEQLIRDWHGKDGRLFLALTPRFALSCSHELLAALGDLRRRHPSVYVQTHHAETPEEVAAVARLFPKSRDYLSVYDQYGLIGDKTILGHSIHVKDSELTRIAEAKAAVAHCPTSNLFLGSGLFPLQQVLDRQIRVALATDVGAGTSLSLLRTMSEAYKVQKLRGSSVAPASLLYHATLGGAKALGQGDVTGSFAPGKDADFQVLAWRRSRLLADRAPGAADADRLFALVTLGDDRLTRRVHVRGREVFRQEAAPL